MQLTIKTERKIALSEEDISLLNGVAAGLSMKEIAIDNAIGHSAAQGKVSRIMHKLGCKNAPHLIATLFREGVLK